MDSIILSNALDYQAVFGDAFIDYLRDEQTAPKTTKQYDGDIRSFLSWLILRFITKPKHPSNPHAWLIQIESATIHVYIRSLVGKNTPVATINSKLSALRSFFSFCVIRGWISDNPIMTIRNLKETATIPVFSQFKTFLQKRGTSDKTITNYLMDIRQFFHWLCADKKQELSDIDTIPEETLLLVTREIIENFKQSHVLTATPTASINRRLSTIRLFCQWAADTGLFKINPAIDIQNVDTKPISLERRVHTVVQAYMADTSRKTLNEPDEKAVITDFFTWFEKQYPAICT